MINHTNFVDPHILWGITVDYQFYAYWMAGIDPFDGGRGAVGWHLQATGCFSIDRGILDRNALKFAQTAMDEGKLPLVIYPEGEADYSNGVLETFFQGATVFAVNTALEKQADPTPVLIFPISVKYYFVENVETPLREAIATLSDEIDAAIQAHQLLLPPAPLPEGSDLWTLISALVCKSIDYLDALHPGPASPPNSDRTTQMLHLRHRLLKDIVDEHAPDTPIENLLYDELMMLKNRLRSMISRKLYAPELGDLEAVLAPLADWKELAKSQPTAFGKKHLKALRCLEDQWIGISDETLALEKRVHRLIQHLQQQVPYARAKQEADGQTGARWKVQMNQTRQIKMLTLILADLERRNTTWEGIDELLVKLEIMLFSAFRYRGPKHADAQFMAPIDVKAYIAERPEQSKRQLAEGLCQLVREQMEAALALPPLGPAPKQNQPIKQHEPV